MSLLDRIVKSSIAENSTNKHLADLSYSAINGERQDVRQQPEGVIMSGQLSFKKPMTAITKEMIEDYQQKERELNETPTIINGVPMKYKSIADLTLKPSIDSSGLVSDTQELIGDRIYISGDIQRLGKAVKDTSDNIKKIKNDIDEKGSNYGNLKVLYQEVSKLKKLEKELKDKNKLYEYVENTLTMNDIKKKDIERENALIAQDNKAKLSVYERELNQANRNRLNLQQQPNESEAEYYKRLKEIQTERYDPILYKQRALTQNNIELKDKLENLFEDLSYKEDVMKSLSDEDKILLNKNFDKIGKSFIDEYGFNNKSLNPKMTAKDLSNKIKLLQGDAVATLASAFKRNQQEEIYRDAILLERDAQESKAKKLQGVLRRAITQPSYNEGITEFIRPSSRIQGALKMEQARDKFLKQKEAVQKLQRAVRGEQARFKYKDELLDYRDENDFQIAKEEELLRRQLEQEGASNKIKDAIENRVLRQRLGQASSMYNKFQKLKKTQQQSAFKDFASSLKEQRDWKFFKSLAKPADVGGIRARIGLSPLEQELEKQKNQELERQLEQSSNIYASNIIKGAYKGFKARSQMRNKEAEEARLRVREALKGDNRSISGDTERSQLSTPAISRRESILEEGGFGKIRKIRSDKGQPRGEYSYDPDKPVGRPRKPRNPVGRPKKIVEEGAKEGQGIRKKVYKRKPIILNKEDKMKNRLRLVASSVDAGNTNPKLIKEVNQLYKKLYDLDNAYMYLKKNK